MLKRLLTAALSVVLLNGTLLAMQPPPPQGEFVPIDQVPRGDQLPAAPLLIAAYAFVWIAAMVYLWTIWRRLTKVEADIRTLENRRGGAGAR